MNQANTQSMLSCLDCLSWFVSPQSPLKSLIPPDWPLKNRPHHVHWRNPPQPGVIASSPLSSRTLVYHAKHLELDRFTIRCFGSDIIAGLTSILRRPSDVRFLRGDLDKVIVRIEPVFG